MEDLQSLIDLKVQESLELDYKKSEALKATDGGKREIAKDVSSFANSAGGRIVYGIAEDNHEPTGFDGGVDASEFSRECLENIIASNISPRIDGLVIRQILHPDGRACYVVEIPAATSRAPHQASDKRYYKRFNFQSVPMEDYEIRDVLRRSSVPDVSIRFSLENVQLDQATGLRNADLVSRISNKSSEPAFYVTVALFLDRELGLNKVKDFEDNGEVGLRRSDRVFATVSRFVRNLSPTNHQPVYRENTFRLVTIPVSLDTAKEYHIGYDISCPGMHVQRFGRIVAAKEIEMGNTAKIPYQDSE